jgi:hypothetical protein
VSQDLDRMSLRDFPLPEELVLIEVGVVRPAARPRVAVQAHDVTVIGSGDCRSRGADDRRGALAPRDILNLYQVGISKLGL